MNIEEYTQLPIMPEEERLALENEIREVYDRFISITHKEMQFAEFILLYPRLIRNYQRNYKQQQLDYLKGPSLVVYCKRSPKIGTKKAIELFTKNKIKDMKIGNKFKFNIALMNDNEIALPKEGTNDIQTVMEVRNDSIFGTLIGYRRMGDSDQFAQVNECWCTPV